MSVCVCVCVCVSAPGECMVIAMPFSSSAMPLEYQSMASALSPGAGRREGGGREEGGTGIKYKSLCIGTSHMPAWS